MPSPVKSPVAHSSLERLDALLRATSEMIGAQIEVRGRFLEATCGHPPLPCCVACSREEPEIFGTCQNRRDDGGPAGAMNPIQWICPRGCEVVVLPLRVQGANAARLAAVRPHTLDTSLPRPDRGETLRFLTQLTRLLAEHISMTSELASVSGELTHRYEELNLLYTISGRLTGQEDMRQAIRMILEQARGAVGAEAAFVHIEERRILEVATSPSVPDEMGSGSKSWRRLVGLLEERRWKENRRLYFSGSQWDLDPNEALFEQPAQILAVAVRTRDEVKGILGLVHADPVVKPRMGDLKLLESLSERVAMAVASSDLYDNLKDFLMATVKSLVSAIEAKDSYTSGHSERVNILSMLLGKTMGLGDEDLEVLRWASILHDIGKIGMPESILKKPGRLTTEEYEIMKEHPDRGYKVLAPIRQLAPAGTAVRCHHEMVDGRGYPLGLRGEEIPLLARIIAVADTYDALTSTRSYRPRRRPDEAFTVIHSVRGTQLDPQGVDALENLMPFIREHEVMLRLGAVDSDTEDDGVFRAEAA